jgi:hypothetical protein
MASPRIKIQGKTYKVPALDDLSMDDILVLDAELQDRYHSSWVKVQEFALESGDLTKEQAAEHPMSTLMGGVTVWMVLRVAGKSEITMQEALRIPSNAVEEIMMDGPKDRQPPKKAAKRAPRKASAPVAVVPPSATEATG